MTQPGRSKEERALESATEAFTRYGYARTTMADIATKAGMSRPALYLLFPDKDAIFDRVVRGIDRRQLEEIRAATAKVGSLQEQLTTACIAWGLHPVELAAAHPDAADLFDFRFPAVRQAYANFERVVAEMIAGDVGRSGIGASPAELARALVYGMRGMRDTAFDRQDLRRMIEIQVEVLVRALCRDTPRRRRRSAPVRSGTPANARRAQ